MEKYLKYETATLDEMVRNLLELKKIALNNVTLLLKLTTCFMYIAIGH